MKQPGIAIVIRKYYEKSELDNQDIQELFSCGLSSVRRMKKKALDKMAETKTKTMLPYHVNTKIAYETWGIDIKDLEKRLADLRRLKIIKPSDEIWNA